MTRCLLPTIPRLNVNLKKLKVRKKYKLTTTSRRFVAALMIALPHYAIGKRVKSTAALMLQCKQTTPASI